MVLLLGWATVFAQEPPPAKVVVAPISREDIFENRPFVGSLYYETTSLISAEVAGLVEVAVAREGDLVKKGAAMVRLNTELLDRDIDVKLAEVARIELRISLAEKNSQRLESLYAKEGVSEKLYEDALYAYQDSLKEKQIVELELQKLLLNLAKSVIKAPYDGLVLRKYVDAGDWIQPGKQLLQLGATSELFVKVPIAETLLRFVEFGAKVAVELPAFNRELQGVVEGVEPLADPKTKNVFLKVRIPAQSDIAENMSALVHVPVSGKKRLSMIPRDALVKMQGQDFVYTVEEGKAALLPVNIVTFLGDRIGADDPHFRAGMVVVVEGNERLRPDQPVVVAGEN
jgi:RND family efflux transporter MFP subunit